MQGASHATTCVRVHAGISTDFIESAAFIFPGYYIHLKHVQRVTLALKNGTYVGRRHAHENILKLELQVNRTTTRYRKGTNQLTAEHATDIFVVVVLYHILLLQVF